MRKYGKKILGIVAAATMLCSVAATAGCGKTNFKMTAPVEADYNANEGKVQSNGGFAVEKGDFVYFVHSFYGAECEESVIATTEYGACLTAAVRSGNVWGVQFHPEKSGDVGLSILKAFCEIGG